MRCISDVCACGAGRWTAFFIDVTMEHEQGASNGSNVGNWPVLPLGDFEYTTAVSVIPNTYPFPDCAGENCTGSLV